MREVDKIASNLFEKVRSRFDNVNVGDENAKSTQDPEKARFFNFDYVSKDGVNFGNITISLIDENALKIYFGKNISQDLDESHKDEWFAFLRDMRQFAKRNLLTFDTRDIARSNLQLKDVKQQSKADSALTTDEIQVAESRMYGSTRSSYQECGPTKIIVRHSKNVDEEVHGARSRNIESVFIETHQGERRLLPFKNLHGARAMARHMSEGGMMEDELGESICSMVGEMNAMAHFVREAKRRQFEDKETDAMAKAAVHHYSELKNKLKHLGGRRGYNHYKETYMPSADVEEEIDVDALRERFVKKIYDDRFTEALPYVYRAYKHQQSMQESDLAKQFESWADDIVEGTWAVPDTESKISDLDEIMAKPLEVGVDGDNASSALYHIIGDDKLFDSFIELADTEGDQADARPLVLGWLQANNPELAAKYQTAMQPQQTTPNQTVGGTTNEPSAPQGQIPAESTDGLDFLRSLAGLRK
jgi:hypothetical protein